MSTIRLHSYPKGTAGAMLSIYPTLSPDEQAAMQDRLAKILALAESQPDLLAACKDVAPFYDMIAQNYPELIGLVRGLKAARAAIAKAEGTA